mgnify:FL=1
MSNKNSLVGANAPDWDEIDPDGSSSRLTQTNRPRSAKGLVNPEIELEPNELPHDKRFDRISVEPERKLRDECVHLTQKNETQSRPLVDCVNEWRDWYRGYEQSHIEFEKDGETVRAPLRNSYQPDYGKKDYAKLKDLERGAERHKDGSTTVMLTLTGSHVNANGEPRCIADHMRDVQGGYNAARKRIADVLSDYDWEYARVWEPHKDGYGHLHIAIFIFDSDPEITKSDFEPVMRSHVRNCKPAGYDAHKPESDAVSMNDEIENIGSYVCEYIGIFGENPLERPIEEQIFYATTWATATQKVTFSNGAHELMKIEQFRRETGLKPEDRGSAEDESEHEEIDENTGWEAKAICTVNSRTPHYNDPTSGGVDMTAIDGSDTLDPPPERE